MTTLEKAKIKEFTHFPINTSSVYGFSTMSETKSIEEIKNDLVQYRIKVAEMEGYKKAISEIKISAKKRIEDYVQKVTKITQYIIDACKKEITDIKIEEARTQFTDNLWVKIVFVVNMDIKDEMKIVKLLGNTERMMLEEYDYMSHLSIINSRDCKIDKELLNSDFPYFYKGAL
ncbi:MAG: hypothetical protein A2452_01120 [Candidatus Firestonebacteria bacterium RIFOXYC2_FULL_39_67]|nr:MAG: hypothetical protein A2536_11185 [Candidatus Firestonebacteria bacterium RIFOXYD2_FULL_39_29]OGF54079.1 MAG: hypothetical protein A2452_01120 [Candidatus Firestonebacteria bacterium RIFOXYC2_FULL_39_67]